ncbi:hypothetical protein IVB06_09670 [Bradyrhizobium sp. 171]|nr:hypothetical protein [Bradyrhizobium sp. 84]MCK1331335.1 hypothetical protein [Bradyrhizobium sp. CW9]MCK1373813.1 hypothetical protein [Bradyrhizobium sp. 49]MCK1411570.1 hypothetical protein [Bradyrhizobium sp. CW4]MCK1519308.1 hypothetical protein [Bradyrhizobium sp. 17]MCK1538311.1 hypothetical protein [Bradyrhizobium sp. 176]MCK1556604.1 hypothetical protein [Bradyrhizobium sp. 171]MCK1583944.1 hypothetical protein [Bradyrhizobium sp. 168]MCK1689128.1 hypothetical protein [Bradyrhiz
MTMTTRLQARRRKMPLSDVAVAVSYHHVRDGGCDCFERSTSSKERLATRPRTTDAGCEHVSRRADAGP